MKYVIAIIMIFFSTISSTYAQSELLNKTWKVRQFSKIFRNTETVMFNKDSLTNLFDYSNLNINFYQDGSYKGTNTTAASAPGTWSLNSKRDSVTIDSVKFLVIQSDSSNFITRGFSLQLTDTLGTSDTSYTYFKLYSIAAALPVVLKTFTGQFIHDAVRLNWSTSAEINNQLFDIEAGYDGIIFEKIGTIPGIGNSSLEQQYSFDDLKFFKAGRNYYRLKQVDKDGNFKFSAIVAVSVDEGKQFSISIYPNPATSKIILSVKQPVSNQLALQLTDIMGRQVWSAILPGNTNIIPLDLPRLAKGVYTVTIVDSKREKLLTDKLIVR